MRISVAPALRSASTSWSFWLRVSAWLLVLFCIVRGSRLVRHDTLRFDDAMAWYGVALALMFAATFHPGPLPWRTWSREGAVEWLARHQWELLVLAAILLAAAFMRLWYFGEYPPDGGMALEEAQAGGIGYFIIHNGLRPLEHPVSGYLAALGFLVTDGSSTSLRMPFVLLGIAAVVPFYLLMRELVSAPAALFATALFAASRWLSYGAGTADELFTGIFFEVTMLWLVVRGVRTGGTWNFLVAGFIGGVLMYEYVSYHVIPPTLLAFLVVVALYAGWKRREDLRGFIRDGFNRFWEPALALTFAALLTLAPLWYASERGELQFGYSSFSRDAEARKDDEFFGLFPPGWEDRVSYSLRTFVNGGDGFYMPLQRAGDALVDPVTATLFVIALIYGAIVFFRPWRLLFVVWFIGVAIMGAAVPLNFHSGRLTTIVPAVFVLIGMLVSDAGALAGQYAERRKIPNAQYGWLALVPLAALAFYLNWDTLYRDVAKDRLVLEYYNDRFYAGCKYLNDHPQTYGYTYSHEGITDPMFRTGDYAWVCEDVRGQPMPRMTELWTLARNDHHGSALMFLGRQPPPRLLSQLMELAYPGTQIVEQQVLGPSGAPVIVVHDFGDETLAARRGLAADYFAGETAEGVPVFSRIDKLQDEGWGGAGAPVDDASIDGPFTVHWRGLIYMPRPDARRLTFDGGRNVALTVSGLRVAGTDASEAAVEALRPGWHTIDIAATFDDAGSPFTLAWAYPDGTEAVRPADVFALNPIYGLRHRTFHVMRDGGSQSVDREFVMESVGWPLSYTNEEAARGAFGDVFGDYGLPYAGDVWVGYVTIDANSPRLLLQARNANAVVDLDGRRLTSVESLNDDTKTVGLDIPPGRHLIRIDVNVIEGSISGARLVIDQDATPPPLTMFTPD